MKNKIQYSLFPKGKVISEFGGEYSRGKRKTARPVALKRPMHFVMRSENARGKYSLLAPLNSRFIRLELVKRCRECNIRLYHWANVGNHLHMLIQAKDRRGLSRFLRVFAGITARRVTGAKRGHPSPFGAKFWSLLVFSRIVQWGRDFRGVIRYIIHNLEKVRGSRQPSMNSVTHEPGAFISIERRASRPMERSSSWVVKSGAPSGINCRYIFTPSC